jgi:hypothetical protein
MLVKVISIMLKNTFTTDDLVQRIALMRIYFSKRLFSGTDHIPIHEALQGECTPYTLAALERWMDDFKDAALSPLVVFEALDAIEEDLAGVPAVTVYFPIMFDVETVEGFGKWFREKVHPNILLTVHTDPTVAGGCSFVWNSIYYDFSFRYYVEKESAAVLKMFDTHLHAIA